KYLGQFLATAAITLAGFLAAALLLRERSSPTFKKKFAALAIVGCCLYTFSTVMIGKATYPDNRWITETALPGRDKMSMDIEGEFSRCDIYKDNDNLGMYWNLPNIQAFHSVVPTSIMEFYPQVGVKRDVSSKPDTKFPELRSLLSVRWLYIDETKTEQAPMRGYTLADNRMGYNIYENDNYIPMGFTYDYYLDSADWKSIDKDSRARALLYGIYADDETIAANGDILEHAEMGSWQVNDFSDYAARRAEQSCKSFTVDNDGFSATSDFAEDELVFFSVPWDKGWSAEVNGEEAEIYKVNVGFMAVRVPAGAGEIRFVYRTPGLCLGGAITGVGLLLLAVWLCFTRHLPPEKRRSNWEQLAIDGFEDEI
ncbi:MAG: YfhO family protein, partial [Angelakisella sp.]